MMKKLSDLNTIKSLLARHGFQFSKKALGQNFLMIPPYAHGWRKRVVRERILGSWK